MVITCSNVEPMFLETFSSKNKTSENKHMRKKWQKNLLNMNPQE